jgi:hypothetical protein
MNRNTAAWIVAGLLFIGGDLLTTFVGIHLAGAQEAHPVGRVLLHEHPSLIVLAKAVVYSVAAVFARHFTVPRFRIWFPVALSAVGALLTAWNLYVIVIA